MRNLSVLVKSFLLIACLTLPGWYTTAVAAETGKTAEVQEQMTTVNVNTASAEVLAQGLAGVGPAKAQAIVAYRKAHGKFKSEDDLLSVKGIGAATLEKNSGRLAF